MTTASRRSSLGLAVTATSACLALALTGCSSKSDTGASQQKGVNGAGLAAAAQNTPPAKVTITPTLSAGRMVTDKPVTVAVTGGTLKSVTVKGADGSVADGTTSASTGTWTPTGGLKLNTTYTITAVATNSAGAPSTATKSVRTFAPSSTTDLDSVSPSSGTHVGNAQPIVVRFSSTVHNRAAVVKALQVSDTKHVEGAWRWMGPTRVDFRPRNYWPLGDKVTLKANLAGVQVSPGVWGSKNTVSTMVVDSDLQAVGDEAKHTLTVMRGGKVIRTMPAGFGMPGFSTWTGPMVVMEKDDMVRMTSCSVGLACTRGEANFYDMNVYYDVRLTESGTFVHSAPWDGNIGYYNTSHGCIHLSTSDARWFEQTVELGNVVTVRGDGPKLEPDNGYGEWAMSWAQWTAPQK